MPEEPSGPLPDAATPEAPWEPQPAFDAGVPEPPTEPTLDELVEYTRECEEATGLTIDEFDCDQGVPIPGQEMNEAGLCKTPNVLNQECDPGSKFQVLKRNAEGSAYAVAHCRKRGLKDGFFDDIAVIAYNRDNGAVCFFQALTDLKGTKVKSPREGIQPWYPDDPDQDARRSRWLTPREMNSADPCVSCHDTGGFVRSPYLAQLTGEHHLPSEKERFNNLKAQPRFVGKDFRDVKTWSIELENEPCMDGDPVDELTGDPLTCRTKRECRSCTSCHSLGVSNMPRALGTAGTLSLLATAAEQPGKLPHSCESPIWMKPNAVLYSPQADEAAQRYAQCARAWLDGLALGVEEQPEGCIVKLNGAGWGVPRE